MALQCFLKYHADAASLLEMVSAMPDCPKNDFLKHVRSHGDCACRLDGVLAHCPHREMTNASIFEKIDDCDELDGNTLLELCKGGLAKMVRVIYQTAKHHMEMLDNFRDLVAQGMTRVW